MIAERPLPPLVFVMNVNTKLVSAQFRVYNFVVDETVTKLDIESRNELVINAWNCSSNCDGFEKLFAAIFPKKHAKYHLFSKPEKKHMIGDGTHISHRVDFGIFVFSYFRIFVFSHPTPHTPQPPKIQNGILPPIVTYDQ